MELKKNSEKEAEKHRGLFLLFGLVMSTAIVFLSFELSTAEVELDLVAKQQVVDLEWDESPITRPIEEPKIELKKPEPPKVTMEIEVVDDTKLIDEKPIDFFEPDNLSHLDVEYVREAEEIEDIPVVNIWELSDKPQFPGGDKAFLKQVSEAVVFPNDAIEAGLTGKITLAFIVNEKGEIADISVVRGIHTTLDNAAIAALKSIKTKWIPGRQMGKNVGVKMSVPIRFELN